MRRAEAASAAERDDEQAVRVLPLALLMSDPVAAGAALIERSHGELIAPLLPDGQPVWDVHAHLGEDADGSQLDVELLLDDAAGTASGATFVFPFRQDGLAAYRDAQRRRDREPRPRPAGG